MQGRIPLPQAGAPHCRWKYPRCNTIRWGCPCPYFQSSTALPCRPRRPCHRSLRLAARSPPAFAAWRCRSRFLSGKTYWCWWLHRISGSCCTGRCWYKACTLCRAACPQCQPPGRSFPGRSRWSVRFPWPAGFGRYPHPALRRRRGSGAGPAGRRWLFS